MLNTNGTIEMSEPLKDVIKQLNDPQTASALKNLAKNAQVLDLLISGLEGFLRRGEEITDNIGQSIHEFVPPSNLNGNGTSQTTQLLEEVPELIRNLPTLAKTGNALSKIAATKDFEELLQPEKIALLKNLADKLSKPEAIESLNKLIDSAPMLVFLMEAIDGFLRRGEEITDNIGNSIREFTPALNNETTAGLGQAFAQLPKILPPLMQHLPALTENLPSLLEQAPALMKTGAKLGEIAESDGVQAFLESDMLSRELVNFLGDTGKVAVKTKVNFQRNPEKLGLWGLYKKSGDEDVQRGLGFLMALAKNFGQLLNEKDSTLKLSSSDRKTLKK